MPDSLDGPDFSKGYLKNIHNGKKVNRKDLLPAHQRRERHRTPCPVAACTGCLCDSTCTAAEKGEYDGDGVPLSAVFPICYVETQPPTLSPSPNLGQKSQVATEEQSEALPGTYPPVPPAVLNRIPAIPQDSDSAEPLTTDRPFNLDDVDLSNLCEEEKRQVKHMLRPFS